jgi:hypothetical protein
VEFKEVLKEYLIYVVAVLIGVLTAALITRGNNED